MFNGFSYSVKGASHEVRGIVCQDSSVHYAGENYAVAVVADGHGSKKHFRSNIGSRLAVESTLEVIARFYEKTEEFDELFPKNHKLIIRNIERQIISEWNTKITEHYMANPVTADERCEFSAEEFENIPIESYYGTTLVASVACRGFSFGFQIGDGSLVAVYEDGTTSMLIDYEESNPANITSSMCNANALSMFADFYECDKKIAAMFLSTDGLYTSFGSDNDFLDYHTIIAAQLAESADFNESVIKNLQKRSNYGTQDDISLSCVYDEELIRSSGNAIKAKVQENKQRQHARAPKRNI